MATLSVEGMRRRSWAAGLVAVAVLGCWGSRASAKYLDYNMDGVSGFSDTAPVLADATSSYSSYSTTHAVNVTYGTSSVSVSRSGKGGDSVGANSVSTDSSDYGYVHLLPNGTGPITLTVLLNEQASIGPMGGDAAFGYYYYSVTGNYGYQGSQSYSRMYQNGGDIHGGYNGAVNDFAPVVLTLNDGDYFSIHTNMSASVWAMSYFWNPDAYNSASMSGSYGIMLSPNAYMNLDSGMPTIPEPASVSLLALGAVGLLTRRRARR